MPIALRRSTDLPPVLTELRGLLVRRERDADVLARMQLRAKEEIQARFDDGSRAYVAWLHGTPVAWGWIARTVATVNDAGAARPPGRGERYLWNIVTLAAFRGRGICPRLLNAMVLAESDDGERFCVVYAPENRACAAAIAKAGFLQVTDDPE